MLNAQNTPIKKEPAAQEYESIVSKNIAIHAMSEKFRTQTANISGEHKKVGLTIIISGLLLMLLFGAGAYYYFFVYTQAQPAEQPLETPVENPNEKVDDPVAPETVPATSTEPGTGEVPKASALKLYLDYLSEVQNMVSVDDYFSLLNRYASTAYIKSMESLKEGASKLSPAGKAELLSIIKKRLPGKTELDLNLKEKTVGENASLSYDSSYGSVQIMIVKEGSELKMDKESGFVYSDIFGASTTLETWIPNKLSATKPGGSISGADTDQDGLTDSEESMLSTAVDRSDSDGDGFSDLKELIGWYNPAGNGKIEFNSGLKQYSDNMFGYECLIPSAWEFKKIESSVFFKKSEQEFFQIVVIPNPEKSDIKKWYTDTLKVADIASDRQIFRQGSALYRSWSAIKSEDGMTVYLTDESREYIYDITYTLGLTQKREYSNIFNLLVSTFRIRKNMSSEALQTDNVTQAQ